jgi:thioester reductase-like protein
LPGATPRPPNERSLAPDGATLLDVLPVDFVARAVIALSRQPAARGSTYHLLHPQPVSSEILFDVCRDAGIRIRRVPYEQWFRHLGEIAREDEQHSLFPLVALFSSRRGRQDAATIDSLPFDTQRTEAALQAVGLQPPKLDRRLFNGYLNALLDRVRPRDYPATDLHGAASGVRS